MVRDCQAPRRPRGSPTDRSVQLEGGSYLALYADDPVCNEIRVDSDEGDGSGPSATFVLILVDTTIRLDRRTATAA